jgi:WD40 repeat protein
MFFRHTFEGHKDEVLDIQAVDENRVATSSEDKTIRIWDLRIARAVQCFVGIDQDPFISISYNPGRPEEIVTITQNKCFKLDLRRPDIICKDSSLIYHHTLGDDLNCLELHPKEPIAALGSDDGTIILLNYQENRVIKRLSRLHTNIVGSISFCPGNANILLSGGFDSVCCAWDCRRGRPICDTIDFSANIIARSESVSTQISNPPFVHDIFHMLGGQVAVCGLGDGSLRFLRSGSFHDRLSLHPVSPDIQAHMGMVSSVAVCKGVGEDAESVISTSTDGIIKGWRLRMTPTPDLLDSMKTEVKSKGKRQKKLSRSRQSDAGNAETLYDVEEIFSVLHETKINRLRGFTGTAVGGSNVVQFLVADVSPTWSLYRASS